MNVKKKNKCQVQNSGLIKKELKVVQQRSRQHNSPCASLFSSEGCWSCCRGLSLAITLPMAESHAEMSTGDALVAPE